MQLHPRFIAKEKFYRSGLTCDVESELLDSSLFHCSKLENNDATEAGAQTDKSAGAADAVFVLTVLAVVFDACH